MKDSQLADKMQDLVQVTKAVVAKMSQQLVIRFDLRPVEQIEIEGFEYDEKGPSYTGSKHSYKQIKDFTQACFDAFYLIAPTNEFIALDVLVKENYPGPYKTNICKQYIFKVLYILFREEAESALQKLNVTFLKQLKDEPHYTKATAYLTGIVMEKDILLSDGCLLRKTNKSDLERPKDMFTEAYQLHNPSAILEIEMEVTEKGHNLLPTMITSYVRLLRLNAIGSVNYHHYDMQFDVITGGQASAGMPHGYFYPWKVCLLKAKDEGHLIHFVNNLIKNKDFLDSRKAVNPINIAFDRYSEGLLENVGCERRIMNAVMGLEALLSDPSPELKFKLSMRVSKLLSYFGFVPLVVKSFVGQAYDIRSSFAHGGHLTPKHTNQLNENFQGVEKFTETILNYLRACLIVLIAAGIEKGALLKAIDDALLDSIASAKLLTSIEKARLFLKTE